MKTLDRLDHEEARQARALLSQTEAAAEGGDVDVILAASTNLSEQFTNVVTSTSCVRRVLPAPASSANRNRTRASSKLMGPFRTEATGRTPMQRNAPRSRLWWMRSSRSGRQIPGCTSTITPRMSRRRSSA